MALVRRVHAAVTRPFRRPQVDVAAHMAVDRQQQRIARRIEAQRRDVARIGLLGIQAETRGRTTGGDE